MYNQYGSLLEKKNKIYRAGLYARLSDADIRDGKDESESIENQLDICRSFLKSHPEIKEVKAYKDDGFTGLNYERNDFKRMMNDIDNGVIDTIITKTLARLGREHSDTIKLFKKDFVEKGVRYIAVNDHIDFFGMIRDFDIPMKVVMNDYYSMEISNNVRTAFAVKQSRGEFTGAFPPYGYKKDPENHNKLIIDKEAAEIVRLIFRSYIDGIPIKNICLMLNDMGVLRPSEYKKSKGYNYTQRMNDTNVSIWSYSTVRKILSEQVYIGTMAQNRQNVMAYNLNKKCAVPKEQWRVKEGMHEPVISKEDYETVQNLIKEHWVNRGDERATTKYMGLLECGNCGGGMTKSKRKNGLVFRCSTYARFGVSLCSAHWITEKTLDEIVMNEINKVIKEAVKQEELLKIKKRQMKKVRDAAYGNLEKQKKTLDALENKRIRMIMNLSNDIISNEDFQIFKSSYDEQKKVIKSRINELKKNSFNDNLYIEEFENWIDAFIKYKGITEITREILINLIQKIKFFETEDSFKVQILFRFKNPFQDNL